MSGMHYVMDLLRALPESLPAQRIQLETLEGQPFVVDAPLKFQKESDRRRFEARLYNLERHANFPRRWRRPGGTHQ